MRFLRRDLTSRVMIFGDRDPIAAKPDTGHRMSLNQFSCRLPNIQSQRVRLSDFGVQLN